MNKILCSLAVLTALGVGAFAPVAHADILGVGLVDPSFSVWGPIYSIDSTTGTATVLNPGTTNQNNGYMDVTTASDGTIYATAQTPFFSEHDDLWTINPTTGATTNVGRITLEGGGDHDGNLKGLAFDPVSGGLLTRSAATQYGSKMPAYISSTNHGALTLIGDTGLFDPNSLARSASGVYYTVDNSPTETNLYTLNVSTGAKTFVANLASSNGSTIDGLAFSPNGALWAIGAAMEGRTIGPSIRPPVP